MAINAIEVACDKTCTVSQSSLNHYKQGNSPASRLANINFATDGSFSNLYKNGKHKKNYDYKSPYLKGDSVHLLSRVTEKRFIHKNDGHISSSFPLATNIYKASSDDLKALKNNGSSKKVLKSVLTLPNDPASAPPLCTVSDMNESEYCNEKDEIRNKARKRNPPVHTRKFRPRDKCYDKDAQYCADMDIHLDSSNETIKRYGDCKKRKPSSELKGNVKENVHPHDVWAVLRNINRFQFRPSPQMSEDSFLGAKKRIPKKRINRKDMRVFETRRTEEYAYISSYKVNKSRSYSPCSSFDKVTVIDKKQDAKVSKEIKDKMAKKKKNGKQVPKSIIKSYPKPKGSPVKRNNFKAITYVSQKKDENTVDKNCTDPSHSICPNNEELKRMITNNASVDLGYESRTTENDEELISFDHVITRASQHSEVVYSDHSGSSKAAYLKQVPQKKVPGKSRPNIKRLDDSEKQISGITKVVLSRGQNVEQPTQFKKIEPPTKLTRQSFIEPTNPINTPKLTKTEVSRQLNKYRFPVVVLGKDQLRSSIHVTNAEHPQFDGLDEQIWPFMKCWYGLERPPRGIKRQCNPPNRKAKFEEVEKKIMTKNSSAPKQYKLKDKVPKTDQKRVPLPLSEIINQVTKDHEKLKPMRQLKDRMLKLLYKNSSMLSVVDRSRSSEMAKKDSIVTKVDTCNDTRDFFNYNSTSAYDINHTSEYTNSSRPTVINSTKTSVTTTQSPVRKGSWAKAKWASDFIENVIKKIKSGAYYNQDTKFCEQTLAKGIKEEAIQTDSFDESAQLIAIPGFDNVLPEIEIKTMNMNEVSVKHCVTNIIVHFDVTVPTDPVVKVTSASSLVPLSVTNSLTKVFKCPTSILNAMLPAELCSILPKLMHNIVESGEHLALLPPPTDKISCLSTITEVPTLSEYSTDIATLPAILPLIPMSPELKQLINGRYSAKDYTSPTFHVLNNTAILEKDKGQLVEDLRPHLTRMHLFDYDSQLMIPLIVIGHEKIPTLPLPTVNCVQKTNTCTALQLYTASTCKLVATSTPFNLINLFKSTASYINNIGLSWFNIWSVINNNNANIDMKIEKLHNFPDGITLRIDNLRTVCSNDYSNSLASFNKISILSNVTDKSLAVMPECNETLKVFSCNKKPLQRCLEKSGNNNKTKRKSFAKLYRKCKSVSHISEEKATPLNRIANLDDFFQVIGSAKHLASVYDGTSGHDLMSSIDEMRNWTSEINAEQALLILLLTNKKNTPNLLRYRPVLVQGIAVKRITKVHELDMEIEVIERENLDGNSRYEGISYLPASIENQDSLYEELCWIAKNTASDYQKPFDQSSERLLKSLLEKRKKLNPSYLRVMARYVGLGLLKSQGKKQTL